MKKISRLVIAVMILSSFVVVGCGTKPTKTPDKVAVNATFTKTELEKYDGKNGNPTYVSVNGVVYDVSSSPLWILGVHRRHNAGKDLTKAIMKFSPHGKKVLKRFPVVGKLIK